MQDAASSNSELVTTSDAAIVSEEDDRDHDLCKSIPRTSNIIHNVRLNAFTQELIGTEVEKEIVDMAHELYELFDEPSFREERRTALVVVLIYLAYQQQDRHVDLYHLMRLRGMTINDIGDVREIYQKCCENRNVSLHFFDSTPLDYLQDFRRYLGNSLVSAGNHIERITSRCGDEYGGLNARQLVIAAILYNHPNLRENLRSNSPLYKISEEPKIVKTFLLINTTYGW